MGRTGAPVRLAPGIYLHGQRVRVVVKAGASRQERSYPAGTDLAKMQGWQLRTKADLLGAQPIKAGRGTLAADIPRYLATLTGRRKKDEAGIAAHWIASTLGPMSRQDITRTQIKGIVAGWVESGVAASTINHRVRVLRNVYRELDGDDQTNPTDKITKQREPEPMIRAVPYDVIEAIIAYMVPRGRATKGQSHAETVNKSRVRARVMAWTGLPPAQLMKVRAEDVHWQAATLDVTPRRKGKGTKARTIPLLPQAVEALKAFFAAGAAGAFSTSSFRHRWLGAQRRLVADLKRQAAARGDDPDAIVLPPIRPYDLRHSFLTEVYRQSRDLMAVRHLGLHAKAATSERYIEGAVNQSANRAIAQWAGNTTPQSEVPPGANQQPHNLALSRQNRRELKRARR